MTLEYSIGDVEFRRLVDEALRRIPVASRGNWTLHAPVDPGITLVELFAWLLEQRSFWADQVGEPLVRGVMALLGETLREPRAAGTVLTFSPEADYLDVADVPRRTRVQLQDTELAFSLRHGLTAIAVEHYPSPAYAPKIELRGVSGADAEDLRVGRPIDLLPAHGGPAQAQLGIHFRTKLQTPPQLPFSLLVDLDTAVRPQWSPDAVAVRAPALVSWEYKDVSNQWNPLPSIDDGTRGLRRSGIVRFAVPADWSAYATPIGWIRVRTEHATFTAPPRLLRIAPNSAIATHSVWDKVLYTPPVRLPLPELVVPLPDTKALPFPAWSAVFVHEAYVNEQGDRKSRRKRWRVVPDFTRSGPTDRHVVVDRARAKLVFGNGVNGRIPRIDTAPGVSGGPAPIEIAYARGGGDSGNVPKKQSLLWLARGPALVRARSLVDAVGGRDSESAEEAAARVSAGLQTPTRLVTPKDHATVACATPGVHIARAHAEVGLALDECGVVPGVTTVFVVPGIQSRTREDVEAGTGTHPPVVDPGALEEVRRHLERARLAGETVRVEPARYRHVRVRVLVAGDPHDPADLRRRLSGALRFYLDPLLGGDDGKGWPFGDPLRPTALLGVAERAIRNRGDVTQVTLEVEGVAEPESCNDVLTRSYELVALDAVDVLIDTTLARTGGLR